MRVSQRSGIPNGGLVADDGGHFGVLYKTMDSCDEIRYLVFAKRARSISIHIHIPDPSGSLGLIAYALDQTRMFVTWQLDGPPLMPMEASGENLGDDLSIVHCLCCFTSYTTILGMLSSTAYHRL